MAQPRLIFVNRVYWPAEAATAQLLTDLTETLAARGWPVHVIASGPNSTDDQRGGVVVHRTGPHDVHAGVWSRLGNYVGFLRAARKHLTALAAPRDIVVLMTDPPLLSAAATAAARGRGAHVVQWIQDVYPEIVSAAAGSWTALPLSPLRWARDRAWRAAARCVTVGADMATTVAAHVADAGSCTVIPNWAPRELQAPAHADAVAAQRALWGLAGKFIAAYSGNLGRVHEFATLLDAAGRLRARRDIVFLVVGSGPRLPAVRAAAEQRRLDNVRFLPAQPRPNLASALAAADVHFVTLRPGFERLVYPSKLAGVLAAARPVLFIGPERCEIARLVARTDCGFACRVGDSAAAAEIIVQMSADRSRCRHLGENARRCYEGTFTLAGAGTAWEQLLREVGRPPGHEFGLRAAR